MPALVVAEILATADSNCSTELSVERRWSSTHCWRVYNIGERPACAGIETSVSREGGEKELSRRDARDREKEREF